MLAWTRCWPAAQQKLLAVGIGGRDSQVPES